MYTTYIYSNQPCLPVTGVGLLGEVGAESLSEIGDPGGINSSV